MAKTPETQKNSSYPELMSLNWLEVDPVQLATAALAKLKDAGHSGVIKNDEIILEPSEVIDLELYRNRTDRTTKPIPVNQDPPTEEVLQAQKAFEEMPLDHQALFDDPDIIDVTDRKTEITKSRVYKPTYISKYVSRDSARTPEADLRQVVAAQQGDHQAIDALLNKYENFVRMKAADYFLAGGDNDDLLQEGRFGLYKAIKDFNPDKETNFRSFASLCITRQLITAVKTATRGKHGPLNTSLSFEYTPRAVGVIGGEGDATLGSMLRASEVDDPASVVISSEELRGLVEHLQTDLSALELDTLRMYIEGKSYDDMADKLGGNAKTIDNALQRARKKIIAHRISRGNIVD